MAREFIAEYKYKRLEICLRLLDRYTNVSIEILSRRTIGDETQVFIRERIHKTEYCVEISCLAND